MNHFQRKLAVAAAIVVVAFAVFLRFVPNSDLTTPESNLRALARALQNDDLNGVARLSTKHGLAEIKSSLQVSGMSPRALGDSMPRPNSQSVVRHRTTETEVVLEDGNGSDYVFVPARNGWRRGWKFHDMFHMVP